MPYDAKLFDSRTDDWASYKAKLIKTNPFANLPFVKDGDLVICQSNACMSYLGAKFGLLGEGEEQRALVEQCLCQVMDLRNDAVALFYGKTIAHPVTDAERYCESPPNHHHPTTTTTICPAQRCLTYTLRQSLGCSDRDSGNALRQAGGMVDSLRHTVPCRPFSDCT